MPYNCRQNVSPYYSSSPCISSNGILVNNGTSFRKTKASSSPLQHRQEQYMKVMPRSFSLSPVSSTSMPLYSSTMTPSNMATAPLSEAFFAPNDDEDMQPLDLSMRHNRDEKTVKQPLGEEHKPICMVKSCTCSTQPEHLSPHPTTGQGVTLSPIPGMTLSSFNLADSPIYTQQQTQSSPYHASSSKTTSSSSSLSFVPRMSPWTTTEASPFRLLVTTDKLLNGAHNSSGLFRPYDDHMHQDMNISTCEETEQGSLTTLSKQEDDDDDYDDDENEEPTYMDLDSTSTVPLSVKAKKNYTGNSSFFYGKQNSPQISSLQNRNNEGKMEVVSNPHQSPLLQALNSKNGHDLSDKRATTYFVGGVISHTSFEKNHKKIVGHTNSMSNSEHSARPKHPQPQLYLPDSSTSPASVPVATGPVNLYRLHTDTHPTTTSQYQDTKGHTDILHNDYPAYSTTSVSSQHLSSSVCQTTNQENIAGNEPHRSPSNKVTTNVPLPVSTSMTSDGVSGNKHRRVDEDVDSVQQVTSEQEGNNSNKISLLDFWISKILMERSMEASQPRKPCNVDYICTANGEKRIRLRLVDLMEMQVEQSMKA